jgi:hypothetical protein
MRCVMVPVTEPDEQGKRHFRCANDGCNARAYSAFPPEQVFGFGEKCRSTMPPPPPGLGDRVELWINRVGITQERYVKWKGMLGGNNCSACERRKKWLNNIRWLNNVSRFSWWRVQATSRAKYHWSMLTDLWKTFTTPVQRVAWIVGKVVPVSWSRKRLVSMSGSSSVTIRDCSKPES